MLPALQCLAVHLKTQTDTQNSIPEPAEAVTGEASAENTEAETDETAETENTDGAVSEAATTSAASDEQTTSGGTAVVYFSATGNTADIAEKVANILNADKFEIIPEEPYTPDDLILITNKTIDKKSSHNPYTQDYAMIFCIVFNWCLV